MFVETDKPVGGVRSWFGAVGRSLCKGKAKMFDVFNHYKEHSFKVSLVLSLLLAVYMG